LWLKWYSACLTHKSPEFKLQYRARKKGKGAWKEGGKKPKGIYPRNATVV
jgi:hypothetical protein